MKQKLDLTIWPRRAHYEFFRTFEEPYYGVCVPLNSTAAYRFAKRNGISFFHYCLYNTSTAALAIEPFRLRIENDEVILYDRSDAGCTIPRPNGTFGFGHIPYDPDLTVFLHNAALETARVSSREDLERPTANNLIRHSALPWINFTSLSHARRFSVGDTCPWISFGKLTESDTIRTMPLSIHVHHALVDGLDLGQFIAHFQELMNA